MAITFFQPEIWAAQLLSVLRKSLVYGGPAVVNRNYEGEIANAGDTVHITSIGDPTIGTYAKDTDITVQVLTDADRVLLIDQQKYFAFEVDDIDKRQVANAGGLMSEAADRAGFGLSDVTDKFLALRMAQSAQSSLGLIDGTTSTNVYDKLIVPASVALDTANVPSAGRFIVLPPAVYGLLQLDARFVRQNEAGTAALHTGVVGEAAGFTILKSNNAPDVSRTAITATTVSGAKTLTGAAGTFSQADVGLTVTGTGVGATNTIGSVNSDGSVATTTVNQSASASVTDIAIAKVAGSTTSNLVIAGTAMATTYAEQINAVEAFRPQMRFADALKGLHLYGAKVVRPESLVVASVKTA
jgi:hypothetical protein